MTSHNGPDSRGVEQFNELINISCVNAIVTQFFTGLPYMATQSRNE